MKKSLHFMVMAAFVFMAAACTLFEKDIQIVQEFTVDINEPEGFALIFSKTKTVDTRHEDITKNHDFITAFELDKVTVQVLSYTGTTTRKISGLSLAYAPKGTNDYKQLGTITDLDLQALADSKVEVPIRFLEGPAKADAKAELIDMMKAGNIVVFKLDGTTSETPIVATLQFNVYANMTISLQK